MVLTKARLLKHDFPVHDRTTSAIIAFTCRRASAASMANPE